MKNKPQLSVIVANFNSAPYITECLDSIVAQSFKDLEIIVYDDCSTDDSPGIIKEYEKNHPGKVRAIFSPVNRGVARTRHEAILRAEGEYITTLDSDDYYYDTRKLEKEMALVRSFKEKHGKDVLAFSNIIKVRGDSSIIVFQDTTRKTGPPNSEEKIGQTRDSLPPGNSIKEGKIFAEIICRSCMIPRDFVMRKEAYFEVGGYDFGLITHEDWDLKIRLARGYEFRFTGIDGTAYRQHPSGLSSIPHHLRTNNLHRVFHKNRGLIPWESRKKITAGFRNFIVNRDREFIKNVKLGPAGARGLGIYKKKVKLIYYLLMNFLINVKWQIKA
jgi:glycosyltransferase involved in cell wall biosynthesis